MPTLGETQKQIATLRTERDSAAANVRKLDLGARGARSRLAMLQRYAPNGAEAVGIKRQLDALNGQLKEHRQRSVDLTADIRGQAGALVDVPIEDLVAQLDDNIPFLMMPVRLETKFASTANGVDLRVRIFPDDIQVTTHDPILSAAERTAGVAYWADRTRALALTGNERRVAEQGAWSLLADRFGGPRARYVARTTKPPGWPAPPAAGAPAAGAAEPVRDALSGVPPRADLLPDFFVVMALDEAGNVLAEQKGRSVPDRLQMGPDPEAPAASLGRDAAGRLAADANLAWLIDFNRAVESGMAVKLPLARGVSVARVVALGVRFSLAPLDAAQALEDLLSDHRFTKGVDILRQGSPTNNTDGAASAFTTDLSSDEALVEQEVNGRVAVATLDHSDKSDSQRLAEALGTTFESIRDWPNADAGDVADALAMNRALWPATVGNFLKKMVGARLPADRQAQLERFFETYVTGRGLLPAIRVGSQPYGVLATSDLRTWAEPDSETAVPAWILNALNWLRTRFETLEPRIAKVGRGADPLAMTMRVVGQQASSVTFASRKAVTDEISWNTLQYEGTIPEIRLNWYETLTARKNAMFTELGVAREGLELANLTFFQGTDPIAGPVVDQDPQVPLSEHEGIAKFDGTRNYIDWLITASTADLRSETFRNSDGDIIPPPQALLYRVLHFAWTVNLVDVSRGVVARLRPDSVVKEVVSPSIVNVGEHKVLPDSHASDVDASALGLAQNTRVLGDFLLDLSRTGGALPFNTVPEVLPLQSQRAAIARLAALPTAVLERVFAEHIDLGNYRLDAWQTGLVAHRLDFMRRSRGRNRGIYLGAYGFVENLVAKEPATPVDQSTLPEPLRGPEPVTEQPRNGGFVHAPSLTHAVTTAVLRNAYLTHTEPTLRETMSVNLTSRRVRAAMSFVEGMRAGQDLAALLGYQLERGLHERYPGVELDSFIYVLRARFPLVSRRLTPVPDGTAAEVVEARNVIDGYDLVEYVRGKDYPYGIADLPAVGTTAADAIVAEIGRLEDTLDSVADLLTAETVHQAVQSNMDRARGAIAAVTDGEMPPVPDVVLTPRSGRVFTQRVALHLPPAAAGWTNPSTPRAAANRRLNLWLATQLPKPDDIGVQIRPSAGPASTLTLKQSGLDAIDIVLMSGDRFGDGSSELERYLADWWRGNNAVGDDVLTLYAAPAPGGPTTFVVVDAAAGAAAVSLATLLPHLRALRHLIGFARGLNAQDYRLTSDASPTSAENPKGLLLDVPGDLAELPARITAARDALAVESSALQTVLDALEAPYKATLADQSTFNGAAWTNPLKTVRQRMRALALYGAAEAVPRSSAGVTAASALALYEQGRAVLKAIAARLDKATQSLAPLPVEPPLADAAAEARHKAGRLDRRFQNLLDAARQCLGTAYPLQPIFRLAAEARAEIEACLASPVEKDFLAIEGWLQSLARVRSRIADLSLACTAAQWTTGAEPTLVPVQLPLVAADPWIAAEWAKAPGQGDIMSVMTVDAPASLASDLEGLLLDDWTETVPTRRETTGIVFNFDRPNAAAPQALLLAVPPNADGRWQWQELVGAVTDTFDRARLRAIEPDDIQTSALFQALPMTLMPFTDLRGLGTTFLNRDYVSKIIESL
jgi:hypothetical protein